MTRTLAIAILIGAVAGAAGCRLPLQTAPDADSLQVAPAAEERLFMAYPQLLVLQKKLDSASMLFYLGDVESAAEASSELIASIGDLRATAPEPAACEFLEDLEGRARSILERISAEELERDSMVHITAVLDSIAANHVAEDEIVVELNQRTETWIRYFQGPGRKHFAKWLDRAERLRGTIEPILVEIGIPRDFLYLSLIESGLNLDARSRMKAVGPWQFMSGTARIFGLRVNWWIDERKDIIASTYAAAHYMRRLHDVFGSWHLALASYNAGEYRVASAMSRQRTSNYWKLRLPRQTEMFVPKFMAALAIGRNPEAYGFEKPSGEPLTFDIITISRSIDLKSIAEAAGCGVGEIKELNPHLKRWATPPGMIAEVKVPAGCGVRAQEAIAKLPTSKSIAWLRHTVQRGETLSRIAARYEVSVADLKKANEISNSRSLRAGQVLLVPVKDTGAKSAVASAPRYRTPPPYPFEDILKPYLSSIRPAGNASGSGGGLADGAADPGDADAGISPDDGDGDGDSTPDASSATAAEHGEKRIVHVVRRGETLSSICRQYGVKLSDVLSWNRAVQKNRIRPGQRITVIVPRG